MVKLFYSYSHKDEELRKELEKHLAMLRRQCVIAEWHDRKIGAGKEWEGGISAHLEQAKIILLLVSSDFLSSDYCYDVEMKRAMERHEHGEARVIPIILRPVDWQGAPLKKLQALPTDAKPVTIWGNRDEAFVDIAKGIRAAVQELESSHSLVVPSTTPGHDAVKMLAEAEEAVLRALSDEHRSNPTGLGLHEDKLRKIVSIAAEELVLIVKGLVVKGLVETGEGTDDDVFGFAKLTSFGIQLQAPIGPEVSPIGENEDEELGVLDYQIAVEESLAELTTQMSQIGQVTDAATPKVENHAQIVLGLKESGGTASQIRSALNALATDMVHYAEDLEAIAPPMHDAWERMVQNTSTLITLTQVQSPEDRTAVEKFIDVIGGTHTTIDGLLNSISTARSQVGVLRGASQDLNRAVRRTERAMDSLANELRTGNQYIESISKLVKDKLNL